MQDANTTKFEMDAYGKVIGIDLDVFPIPRSTYECVGVKLINENDARGQTIATVMVLDGSNVPTVAPVYLAWPHDGSTTSLPNKSLPGNQNFPAQHVIVNSFDPGNVKGPLAIYVGGPNGEIRSDVVGGLGLPYGHHVGFYLTFRERAQRQPEPVVQPDVPVVEVGASLAEQIAHIVKQVDRIAAKVL